MMETEAIAKIFKALCDPNRVAIVQLLQEGELCACHIGDQLGLAQSKLSYHMKILCESGLVESWSVGKWTHYQISPQGRDTALITLTQLTAVREGSASCGGGQTAI